MALNPLGLIGAAGSVAGGIPSIIAYANYLKTAKEQKNRANNLEGTIVTMRKDPLSQYYKNALTGAETMAAEGLPGYETYQNRQDQESANQLKAIEAMSPSGSTAVGAINRALIAGNDAKTKIDLADASARTENMRYANETSYKLGGVDAKLQEELNAKKIKTQQMVEALRNASTNNRQNGISGISSSVTGMLGGATKGIMTSLSTPETTTSSTVGKTAQPTANVDNPDNTPYTEGIGGNIAVTGALIQQQKAALIQQYMAQGLSEVDATAKAMKTLGLGNG